MGMMPMPRKEYGMTYRRHILTGLVLLPLGLAVGMTGTATAGSAQTAIPQATVMMAENDQINENAANSQNGAQDEGNVESNDGAQNEGNAESENGGKDQGGVNSEHQNEGEENGEN